MPTYITTMVKEESTCVATSVIKDRAGAAMIPVTMVWSLLDREGNVINSRDSVSVSSPASSNDIVLSGDDLELLDPGDNERILLVEITFSSDIGSNLPYKDELHFYIENLTGV